MAFDDDFAAAAAPDLLAVLGGPVVRWPAGDSSDPATVTGIFEPADPKEFAGDRKGAAASARLLVAAAQATDERDVWVVNGQAWAAIADPVLAGDGLKAIELKRNVPERDVRGGRR